MPRKCSIYGCRSNYRGEAGEHVTTFSLPKDEALRKEWIRKIPTDLTNLKMPQVCIKHFMKSNILRTDICIVKGERKEFPRKIPKLKEGAIPVIFPKLPKYLSAVLSLSTSRRLVHVEEENIEKAIASSPTTRKIVRKDNLQNNNPTGQDSTKFLDCKNSLDTGLTWTSFTGTNGSGLAVSQKYGTFTSESVTLNETAVNNKVLRVPLLKDDLIDLKTKYAFKTIHKRKYKKPLLPTSSFGRKLKKSTFHNFENNVKLVKIENLMENPISDRTRQKSPQRKKLRVREDLKPSVSSKIQGRFVPDKSIKRERTLNNPIKKDDKSKIKVKWFGKDSSPSSKKKVRNGEIRRVTSETPTSLHREILFVKQCKPIPVWEVPRKAYYLKFSPQSLNFNDGKLAYNFQKLVTDVKYMKLPTPTWKIKVIIRQGKIAAITFTNKLTLERCVSFSAQNNYFKITIDNRPALLIGSPGKVDNSNDIEVLLDIVQNIEPKNPMLLFK